MPVLNYASHKPLHYETAPVPGPWLGLIIHVQMGYGSLHEYFNSLPPGKRVNSHFWVSKGGVLESYVPTDRISWAQAAGNSKYLSVETEGYDTEPLTQAQIMILGLLVRDLNIKPGRAIVPGDRGVGTHSMGGKAWGGHSCPGKLRESQIDAIIKAAILMYDGIDEEDMDLKTLANWDLSSQVGKEMAPKPLTYQTLIARLYQMMVRQEQEIAELKELVTKK